MNSPPSIGIIQRGNVLSTKKITLPELKEHQVCVRVESAAFNPTDSMYFSPIE